MRKADLYVCTKPYQYLICRLIRDAFDTKDAELIVLDHFPGANAFAERLRSTGPWSNVYFVDDRQSYNERQSTPVWRRPQFYKHVQRYLPLPQGIDYDNFDRAFIAHETVPAELAIIRLLGRRGNQVLMYEEGIGNYARINRHRGMTRWLKDWSIHLGIPGSYMGQSREVGQILLQFPDALASDARRILGRKVRGLPQRLGEFLRTPSIKDELGLLYQKPPKGLLDQTGPYHLLLTEPPGIVGRTEAGKELVRQLVAAARQYDGKILLKQHPGDDRTIRPMLRSDVGVVPKELPAELIGIYLAGKRLHLWTFGSTAALNLALMVPSAVVHLIQVTQSAVLARQAAALKRLLGQLALEIELDDVIWDEERLRRGQ